MSEKAVAIDEDGFEYEILLMSLTEQYEPATSMEAILVERLANLIWRERRLITAEASMIDKANLEADLMLGLLMDRHLKLTDQHLIGRYQGVLGRQIRDTLRDLHEAQEDRSQESYAHNT